MSYNLLPNRIKFVTNIVSNHSQLTLDDNLYSVNT